VVEPLEEVLGHLALLADLAGLDRLPGGKEAGVCESVWGLIAKGMYALFTMYAMSSFGSPPTS
jgi:hypothetical protein